MAALGLVALTPVESKAEVGIYIGPAYRYHRHHYYGYYDRHWHHWHHRHYYRY